MSKEESKKQDQILIKFEGISSKLQISDYQYKIYKDQYASKLFDKGELDSKDKLLHIKDKLRCLSKETVENSQYTRQLGLLIGEHFTERFHFNYVGGNTRSGNSKLFKSYVHPLLLTRFRSIERPNNHTGSQYAYLYRLISTPAHKSTKSIDKSARLDQLGIQGDFFGKRLHIGVFGEDNEYGRMWETEMLNSTRILLEALNLAIPVRVRVGETVGYFGQGGEIKQVEQEVLEEWGYKKNLKNNENIAIQKMMN